MARQNKNPRPGKRFKDGRWRIYWRQAGKVHEAVILTADIGERLADVILAQATAALDGRGSWPPEIRDTPAVKRWILAREREENPDRREVPVESELLLQYRANLEADTGNAIWQKGSMVRVKEFLERTQGVEGITSRTIGEYLDAIVTRKQVDHEGNPTGKTNKPATRNRARAQLSRFCRWLRRQGYRPGDWNPLRDIKTVKEERPAEGITVLEPEELEAVLLAADKDRGGIAVWLAIYAGLRRGEIYRIGWDDVGDNLLTIRTSKTGDGRHVPLSAGLAERLKRETRKGSRIVPWPEIWASWETASRRLVTKLAEVKVKNGDEEGKPIGDKVGWNTFRHTFASRLVRKGLPLDLVAAWMGNTPTVCRRHYARFVPTSLRDTRIDLVD